MNSYSVAKEPIFFNEDEKRLLSRIVSSRVTFNDVCGMDDAKRYLETPLLYNETRNHKEGKGFLLLGPPGTGKSFLIEALVGEARARPQTSSTTFLSLSLPLSELVNLRDPYKMKAFWSKLFMVAEMEKPSIIVIEELDALMSDNINIVGIRNAFCVEMKNKRDGVFVVCTTNKLQELVDIPEVLKSFDYLIYISVPSMMDRLKILKKLFAGEQCKNFKETDFQELARRSRGMSGSDLTKMYADAAKRAHYYRMQRTSGPVDITTDDIGGLQRYLSLELKAFDDIAAKIRALNGNIQLERAKKDEISCGCRLLSSLTNIFF